MSSSPDIRCPFCDYQFKTFSRVEEHYVEYDLEEDTYYYPLPEEINNPEGLYICNDCYSKMSNIVKEALIKSGIEYINKIEERKQEEYKKFLNKIEEIEKENNRVFQIYKLIKDCKYLSELGDDTINTIIYHKYPFAREGSGFLDKAIRSEKRLIFKMKLIMEWEKEYGIEIEKLPEGYSKYDFVRKEDFKDILLNSKLKNIDLKQLLNLVRDNKI